MNYFFLILISLLIQNSIQKSDAIEDFTLTEATSKDEISLSSFASKKLIVVVFTSNYCPYAKLYEQRLINLQKQYLNQSVQFLLINSNDPKSSPEDTEARMKVKADNLNYPFPYLVDKDQEVARLFNAQKTPEAFLLQSSGEGYKILYQGAIDDNPQVSNDVKSHYLKQAIDNALQNQKIQEEYVRPTGCLIR